MKDWLERFFNKEQDEISLVLNGRSFSRKDCKLLGSGSEKQVFQVPESSECFFIPRKWSTEENWKNCIKTEKILLDQMAELGLKTQRFELVQLTIQKPGKPDYVIDVLTTKDFQSLCVEESLVIYNPKGAPNSVIGGSFDDMDIANQLSDKAFAQKMLKEIIKEYAVALTFALPVSVRQPLLDDSEHICFALAEEKGEPPVARYMFWDVAKDFYGVDHLMVPTLAALKSGGKRSGDIFYSELYGLKSLANTIACAISEIKGEHGVEYARGVEQCLLLALNDDEFLNQALVHARNILVKYLDQFLTDLEDKKALLDPEGFIQLLKMVISSGRSDLVRRALQHQKDTIGSLSQTVRQDLRSFAESYENQVIIEIIKDVLPVKENTLPSVVELTKASKVKVTDKSFFHSNNKSDTAKAVSGGILVAAGFIGGGLILSGATTFAVAPFVAIIVISALLFIGGGLFANGIRNLLNADEENVSRPECI